MHGHTHTGFTGAWQQFCACAKDGEDFWAEEGEMRAAETWEQMAQCLIYQPKEFGL